MSLLPNKSESESIDIFIELARAYGDSDYWSTDRFSTMAIKLALIDGDSMKIVKSIRLKSQFLRRMGKVDSAIFLFNKILPTARMNNYADEIKSIVNGLGVAYLVKSKYDIALQYFHESLDLRSKSGDRFEISVALNNLGIVYYRLGDFQNALSYYKKSLELKKSINDKTDLDILLLNISLCYAYLGDFSQAKCFVDEGLSLCNRKCSQTFRIVAHHSLGLISYLRKSFNEAERQLLQSYKLSKVEGYERYHLDNIALLLNIYINRDDLVLSQKYVNEAEDLVTSDIQYNEEMIQVFIQLASLHSKLRNFEKATHYQDRYITLKNKIYNEKMTTNLMKIEAEHLERENKAKIESQNKILALNEEVIIRQKYLNVFIGLVTLLLFALAIVLIRSNRQKQKINQLLDKKVRERTWELELNQNVLRRACEERDVLIDKTAADIRRSLATIKGLCGLGKKDIHDACQYLEKVNATVDNFSETIDKLICQKLPIKN